MLTTGQGCRQLFSAGGGGGLITAKKLQFGSRVGCVGGGYYTKWGSKNFLQNPRGIRKQIRV